MPTAKEIADEITKNLKSQSGEPTPHGDAHITEPVKVKCPHCDEEFTTCKNCGAIQKGEQKESDEATIFD